jgi:dihydroorotase
VKEKIWLNYSTLWSDCLWNYNKSQDNANLLKIALQYVQDFDGLVIAFPKTKKIKGQGVAS